MMGGYQYGSVRGLGLKCPCLPGQLKSYKRTADRLKTNIQLKYPLIHKLCYSSVILLLVSQCTFGLLCCYYFLFFTKYISVKPLCFTSILPRLVQAKRCFIKSYVVLEIFIWQGSPCCCIRAAVFTVSPQIS